MSMYYLLKKDEYSNKASINIPLVITDCLIYLLVTSVSIFGCLPCFTFNAYFSSAQS